MCSLRSTEISLIKLLLSESSGTSIDQSWRVRRDQHRQIEYCKITMSGTASHRRRWKGRKADADGTACKKIDGFMRLDEPSDQFLPGIPDEISELLITQKFLESSISNMPGCQAYSQPRKRLKFCIVPDCLCSPEQRDLSVSVVCKSIPRETDLLIHFLRSRLMVRDILASDSQTIANSLS